MQIKRMSDFRSTPDVLPQILFPFLVFRAQYRTDEGRTPQVVDSWMALLKCSVSVLLFLLRLFPYLLLFAFCTRDPLCIRLLRNFLRSFFHLRSTCLSIYSILYLVLMLSQSLV